MQRLVLIAVMCLFATAGIRPAFAWQSAAQQLEELVREGYLRQMPLDPIVGNNSSWKVIMEDAAASASQSEPGIFDVRSSSEKTSLEGTPYSDW